MENMKKPAKTQEMMDHLDHVDYPITGKEFLAACNNMSHATREERDWAKMNVQADKTYNNMDELKRDLKM